MSPMRLLVTGGAGFVGSNLCLQLRERHPDWDVVALDTLYRRGSELNLPRFKAAGVEFVHADVRSPDDLARVGRFDAMVECSAEPSVMAAGDVVVPVNLFGAHHCFEAARAYGAHVVFLSTSRVYPVAALEGLAFEEAPTRFELAPEQDLPGVSPAGVAEDFPLHGSRTMYGASKLAAELLLQEHEMPWTINRCGVLAGPWQMGKVDQGVFTHWVLSHVFGGTLKYIGYGGEGKQVRDLLHIDDLVSLVDEQLVESDRWAGRTFNVGGGRAGSLSLRETTAICRELTGVELDIGVEAATRAGDVRCYISDCAALLAHTRWRPSRTPRDILADIHAWVRANEPLVKAALT